MIRKLLLVSAFVALATPAFAFKCPADMAKIDAALQTAQLSAGDKAKVMELRKQGQDLHAAGKHQDSVKALAEAMALLGIS